MSTFYGVTSDYDYNETRKREKLNIWSGAFSSTWEATAVSLPKGDGYMVTTYNGDKLRVSCPTPRNDENYQAIDQALGVALEAHYQAVRALPIAEHVEIRQDPATGTYWRSDGKPGHTCSDCGNGYATAETADPSGHDCPGLDYSEDYSLSRPTY